MPKIPEGAKKPADRLVADATGDSEPVVMLGDTPIRVLPRRDWKKWALAAMVVRGDLDQWARGAVHPDDVQAFIDADVTIGQTEDFMEEWGRATGEDLGESGASRRS